MKNRRSAGIDAPALEWLSDLSGKTARITSVGGKSLLVENHRGILSYESGRILLSTRCGNIEISGENLCLTEVRRDALVVRGEIRHVELPCGEESGHEV